MSQLENMGDEALMDRIKAEGDRAASGVLIQRHKAHAFKLALQLCGDRDDALDISQEAFVKVLTRAGRYQSGRPFWPWFAAILRNTARSLQRTPWRRRVSSEALLEHLADPGPEPGAAARAAELWRVVLELPPALREVMVLRHMEGMDYAQMAEVLGVPQNTVASRLYAARQKVAARYAV